MSDWIYLDNQATTPVDPRVLEAMMPYFTSHFGNIASDHVFGYEVREACSNARQDIARLIGADADEIVFTSGATESNNLAIKGVAEGLAKRGMHIVTCVTEHRCVLETLKCLEQRGFSVTYLPVDADGAVSVEQVQAALRLGEGGKDRTILVTLMGANNEVGTLHPIQEVGAMLTQYGICFHCDGAQLASKVPVDVESLGVHLMSLSAHKMYGPKGIGALYVSKSLQCSCVLPQMHGGGQEFGLRSGTLAVPLVVGFGAAARFATAELVSEQQELATLRRRLWNGLREIGDCEVNGPIENRIPGNLSVTFKHLDGEMLKVSLKGVAVSSSSACSSAYGGSSHVLTAMGRTPDECLATLRFGIGRFNGVSDIDFVISSLKELVPKLRSLYAKRKSRTQGIDLNRKAI